jgi:hypothetical protein
VPLLRRRGHQKFSFDDLRPGTLGQFHEIVSRLARPGLYMRFHIRTREHSTASLARILNVSPATVSRALKDLRPRLAACGKRLIVVKEGRTWHDEVRTPPDAWMKDPLFRSLGLVPGVPRSLPKATGIRPEGVSVDDALYPRPPGLRG